MALALFFINTPACSHQHMLQTLVLDASSLRRNRQIMPQEEKALPNEHLGASRFRAWTIDNAGRHSGQLDSKLVAIG